MTYKERLSEHISLCGEYEKAAQEVLFLLTELWQPEGTLYSWEWKKIADKVKVYMDLEAKVANFEL